ncbi:hypothetical protein ACG873_02785 [Mesorhizobium sp. AaZ16]|uniref:hypothetical protein n=1 Tax=Mesorhizobium sp. AaZ16 TaxID=3402289 RepID=UPI00374E7F38
MAQAIETTQDLVAYADPRHFLETTPAMNGPTLPLTGCHLLAASCRHVFRRRHAVSRNNPLTSARKPSPSIATDHRLRLMRLGKRTAKATRSPLQAPRKLIAVQQAG